MAVFSSRRRATRRRWAFMITTTAMTAAFLLVIGSAVANLPGSGFDAGDGNLVVNDEAKDWANIGIDCPPGSVFGCALDKPTGQTDDSFGQGTKEDTPAPTVVDGSIPNNKSDLLRFYVANERVSGKEFLYLAWERVQEPNGTTNMDFEFNQRQCTPGLTPADPDCSANGVTPIRSAGDVLIKYDLSQGGVNPTLGFHRWVTTGNPAQVCEANNSLPCWDKVHPLAGNFEGAINDASNNPPSGSVVDPIAPNAPRTLSPRTFGEAAVNLTDSGILPSTSCASFGSAYLKSRSSDSFTAALKDFIAPIPVSISNCGKIIIAKVTDPNPDPTDASFGFTLTGGPSSLNQSFNLKNGGTHDSGDLFAGSGYSAAEVSVPSGWTLVGGTCDDGSPVTNIDVSVGETVTCTFTNQARGRIVVEKVTSDGSGSFDFTSGTLSPSPFTLTTSAAGQAGKASRSFSSLSPGTYDVAETVPAGWNLTSATCDDGSNPASIGLGAGETVTCTFVDARERGAILITKTRKHAASGAGDHPHAGVKFTITGGELPASGVEVTTDSNGQACLGGLVLSSFVGNYTVSETVPAGYKGEAAKVVTVDNEAACADSPYGGESVSFHNTPLTDLSVSVDSQVDGGTSSDIECKLGSTVVGSAGPGDDPNLDLEDLEPGTYVCTVVIDP